MSPSILKRTTQKIPLHSIPVRVQMGRTSAGPEQDNNSYFWFRYLFSSNTRKHPLQRRAKAPARIPPLAHPFLQKEQIHPQSSAPPYCIAAERDGEASSVSELIDQGTS